MRRLYLRLAGLLVVGCAVLWRTSGMPLPEFFSDSAGDSQGITASLGATPEDRAAAIGQVSTALNEVAASLAGSVPNDRRIEFQAGVATAQAFLACLEETGDEAHCNQLLETGALDGAARSEVVVISRGGDGSGRWGGGETGVNVVRAGR